MKIVSLENLKYFYSKISTLLGGKVDKVEGKQLSTEDFTTLLKTKLEGVEEGAQVNTITGIKGSAETDYRVGNVEITKANIGLTNVEDKSSATIRSELTATDVTTALTFTPMDAAIKGAASGVAELDENGKIPTSQLPSYVSDVIEANDYASLPTTGEANKIYVTKDTNLTYRWSGTQYVEISQSLAIGETSATAFAGDKGKIAYDHVSNTSNPHGVTAAQVGLDKVENKTGAEIRAELTSAEVVAALGFTPLDASTVESVTNAEIDEIFNPTTTD